MTQTRFLMCQPDFFSVEYVINPWMEGNINRSAPEAANSQWQALYALFSEHAEVSLITPQAGLPDMVFTANAGLVLNKKVVLSSFFHPERAGEEKFFKDWFQAQGFSVFELPPDVPFEGAGDALFDRQNSTLWAGYGFRTELESHALISEWLDIEVHSLHLIDDRFYHLDTCFCPLEGGYLLYYPPAFDHFSNRLIEMRIAKEKLIPLSEQDALAFACNAVNIEKTIILNQASPDLIKSLREFGFSVLETPLSEFIKAGGSAKCLTLRLTESLSGQSTITPSVESRVIQFQGHLLDSGLISSALDIVVNSGGSFQILSFQLGEQRQSASSAEIRVLAPSKDILDRILPQLIQLGAELKSTDAKGAVLLPVEQAGVAPDDFYVTTIFPTEVFINGEWLKVDKQRMDGAIAVAVEPSGKPTAECKLLRDLSPGESVVVGVEGIRTIHKAKSREQRQTQEFTFMGAGVSSERRVELVVEQVAWDLRQIRDRGGKVVVTAGPVVIHTGGADHLSRLIREGYVQALLGGNAIAVHDIEQSLLGTSLGVDMNRGVPVQGGHRHHLKVINLVRRAGSIREAVAQGILTKGVMFECVTHNIPFSLAGSIRDDGPLPDTEMDLIKAQSAYAELIEGADLILMLSSMLHSIGVGNMTPAGPKMVCVDINPAVVTKLSDRGSVQSVGVVTDVGLFLSLLVQQLDKFASPLQS